MYRESAYRTGAKLVADSDPDLAAQRGALERVLESDLAEFNAQAAKIDLPFVIVPED